VLIIVWILRFAYGSRSTPSKQGCLQRPTRPPCGVTRLALVRLVTVSCLPLADVTVNAYMDTESSLRSPQHDTLSRLTICLRQMLLLTFVWILRVRFAHLSMTRGLSVCAPRGQGCGRWSGARGARPRVGMLQ
jgi:hypothetical protein